MGHIFAEKEYFDTDLSKWDVSRVTDMMFMFLGAMTFKQSLCGEAWVLSKATKTHMFYGSPGEISKIICGACFIPYSYTLNSMNACSMQIGTPIDTHDANTPTHAHAYCS